VVESVPLLLAEENQRGYLLANGSNPFLLCEGQGLPGFMDIVYDGAVAAEYGMKINRRCANIWSLNEFF